MSEFTYCAGAVVTFVVGEVFGSGTVLGVHGIKKTIVGHTYIVDVLTSNITLPNDTYPFSVITVSECDMKSMS